MDRITSMHVFVRVVELGGFAAAAREFGISPAMVAKHVQGIEARLGARVLNRTTRRQSLTEVGRLYVERSKLALQEFEAAESAASELQAAPRGTLRVTAPVVFGSHGVAPLLSSFMAQYPQVQVELSLHDRVVDLVDEGYDLAVRTGPVGASGFVARPLRPLRMLLCAAPAYLKRRGVPRPAGRSGRARLPGLRVLGAQGALAPGGAGGRGNRAHQEPARDQQRRGLAPGGAGGRRHPDAVRPATGP